MVKPQPRARETGSVQPPPLPEGWAHAALQEVTVPVPHTKPEDEPLREFRYIDISSISNRTHEIAEFKSFKGADAPSRARRPIKPDDVLFSNVRTYLRNIAVVTDDVRADLCSTGFTVLRSNGAIDSRFLLYSVLTDAFIDAVGEFQTGTHYPAVSDPAVFAQEIALPPLAEQKRIVAKIEALLARVTASRERLAKLPVILNRFRQSVLAAACSGRLTADWREFHTDIEPASQLLKNISVDCQRTSNNQPEDDLPELPETWAWSRFAFLIGELRNGISTKPNIDPPGTKILRINSVRPGAVLFDDVRFLPDSGNLLSSYRLREGDLLFTRYNGSLDLLGVCGMVRRLLKEPLLYPDKLMRVRFDHAYVVPAYVEIFFQSPDARDRLTARSKSSAGQQGVSGADIKAQPVALPPLEEQREIVRRVAALFKLADAIVKRVAIATARAEKLTQSILTKAFRGELVPTEAELARHYGREYEPAFALLARTQAGAARDTGARPERRRRAPATLRI